MISGTACPPNTEPEQPQTTAQCGQKQTNKKILYQTKRGHKRDKFKKPISTPAAYSGSRVRLAMRQAQS